MHTKFEVVLTVIFRAGTKCCECDIQREITQSQHEVELQFLGTALLNIATKNIPNFKSFLLKMTKFCSGQARNAIKMKVKWGKVTKNLCWEVMVLVQCTP